MWKLVTNSTQLLESLSTSSVECFGFYRDYNQGAVYDYLIVGAARCYAQKVTFIQAISVSEDTDLSSPEYVTIQPEEEDRMLLFIRIS